MAGIYIHIPFCKQACHYCNFHFSTSLRYKNELITALLKEIELSRSFLPGRNETGKEIIETIYFGGGTPSLLSKNELQKILKKIQTFFTVSEDAEITLEANPDDISTEALKTWKEAGINRLSIGIQSFFDEDLLWMNRVHTAEQASQNLQLTLKYFDNISVDLIYGMPGLTNKRWEQNVEKVISFNIPHLSCYALTVEPKTPLQKLIQQHKSGDVDPDKQSEQLLLLMEWLNAAGYEHYEISNFAKVGLRSKHNSSYWQGKNYYGFGPSAHSFDGKARWWNISNNNIYIQSLEKGIVPFEKEELTVTQKANEYIMTSLRTMEGLDLRKVKSISEELRKKSQKYIINGLMVLQNDNLILTNKGKLLADGIASDLFTDQ